MVGKRANGSFFLSFKQMLLHQKLLWAGNYFKYVQCRWAVLSTQLLNCIQHFVTPWAVAHQAPLSMGILQAKIQDRVAMPSSRGSSRPRIKPKSPALQVDSLVFEPPGKPKNTGVGSLSLLQGIFQTHGLNPGLPHCRQILYQLSHKGNPRILEWVAYPFSSGSS